MDFIAATHVDEALDAMADLDDPRPLAGGTDLMVGVNLAHDRPTSVVSVRRIDALADMDTRRIGSGVTWEQLERSEHRGLAQAARTVGSPQIRSAGTIGGNIATASPAGDGLPWIAAAEATIVVRSRDRGERTIRWDDFFVGVKRTSLAPDELIVGVEIPNEVPEIQEFAKVGVRNAMVIATVSCLVMRGDDGFRIALGSVAPTPIRARRTEAMLSEVTHITDDVLDRVAAMVAGEVRPITDHRSTAAYRTHAAGVLARRLVQRCLV